MGYRRPAPHRVAPKFDDLHFSGLEAREELGHALSSPHSSEEPGTRFSAPYALKR